jgi:hypothetical protein
MLAEYRDAVGATEAITNFNQQRGNKNLRMLCKQYRFLGSSRSPDLSSLRYVVLGRRQSGG